MSSKIGQTIADQIGGRAFVMLGAKDLITTENGLQFAIGKNGRGINRVVVELDADDTYTVKFWNVSISRKTYDVKIKAISECSSVYADSLHRVIENATGLYTSI